MYKLHVSRYGREEGGVSTGQSAIAHIHFGMYTHIPAPELKTDIRDSERPRDSFPGA